MPTPRLPGAERGDKPLPDAGPVAPRLKSPMSLAAIPADLQPALAASGMTPLELVIREIELGLIDAGEPETTPENE